MCEIIYLNTSTCCNGFNGFKIGFIWEKILIPFKNVKYEQYLMKLLVGIGGL